MKTRFVLALPRGPMVAVAKRGKALGRTEEVLPMRTTPGSLRTKVMKLTRRTFLASWATNRAAVLP